jgi:hypothetical protein
VSLPFCQQDMRMVSFSWVPWSVQYRANWGAPVWWFPLGGEWYVSSGIGAEPEERVILRLGPVMVTRPETDSEREEREEAEAEAAFMEREHNRYTEWYY